MAVRVAEDDPGVGQSQPLARVAGGVLEQAGRAVARRPSGDRGDRPLDLAVPAGEAGGQGLLLLGEAAELVVGEGRQGIGALAGGDPVEARAQRPQWRGDGADQEAAHGKPDEGRDDERGQHQGQDPAAPVDDEEEPEERDREDGGDHRSQGDPGAQPAADHRGGLAASRRAARQDPRTASAGAPLAAHEASVSRR